MCFRHHSKDMLYFLSCGVAGGAFYVGLGLRVLICVMFAFLLHEVCAYGVKLLMCVMLAFLLCEGAMRIMHVISHLTHFTGVK